MKALSFVSLYNFVPISDIGFHPNMKEIILSNFALDFGTHSIGE